MLAFPTGDLAAKNVVKYQPAAFAGMEGIFKTEQGGSEIIWSANPTWKTKSWTIK
jgi:cytochrome d ubiquinol oxidase subunit I